MPKLMPKGMNYHGRAWTPVDNGCANVNGNGLQRTTGDQLLISGFMVRLIASAEAMPLPGSRLYLCLVPTQGVTQTQARRAMSEGHW
jgi:hypothetical protein